ncbi:MAG: 4Fe-4S binding protein [Bacteroidaceae bacterium]|nr:4Fe-4S binding protein [Bacteroidaceae bacterium]
MLRKIRIILATLFFVGITALFLDFTGTLPAFLGWMAKVQFVPALLAVNVAVVVGLLLLTLLFGRLYCSVICPLGVMQDIVSWLAGRRMKRRFSYSKGYTVLRVIMLVLFAVALVVNVAWLAAFIEPYSAYGRIVNNLFAPIYLWGNNLLAYIAERADSYAFYSVDVWLKSGVTLAVAAVTFVVVVILAWRGGRTWCNSVCPVGTLLGAVSRFSLFKPVINLDKCNGCKLCSKNCKASCINAEEHKIDYSRCVVCMDCVDTCKRGAITYRYAGFSQKKNEVAATDNGRRQFIAAGAMVASGSLFAQANKKVDGGLAVIEDKKVPERATPIVPVGSKSLKNFTTHCTACQLCVSKCPNDVLRPSSSIDRLMQPEMSFERGFCRPACTACADVCPNGAIKPIQPEQKSSTKIGTAVWVADNCIANKDGVTCNNCERHCPNGAIKMIRKKDADNKAPRIPMIDVERCLGCGACEYVCPARPFSAIFVEGIEEHREI